MRTVSSEMAAAYSTTVPVVTALLASLSGALLIVPLATPTAASAPSGRDFEFPPVTADQIAVVAGIVAAALFVAASVSCVYGAAADQAETKKRWFNFANLYWVYGLPLLLLTTGALACRQVSWLLPISAIVAAFVLSTGNPMGKRCAAIVPAIGLFGLVIAGLAI